VATTTIGSSHFSIRKLRIVLLDFTLHARSHRFYLLLHLIIFRSYKGVPVNFGISQDVILLAGYINPGELFYSPILAIITMFIP